MSHPSSVWRTAQASTSQQPAHKHNNIRALSEGPQAFKSTAAARQVLASMGYMSTLMSISRSISYRSLRHLKRDTAHCNTFNSFQGECLKTCPYGRCSACLSLAATPLSKCLPSGSLSKTSKMSSNKSLDMRYTPAWLPAVGCALSTALQSSVLVCLISSCRTSEAAVQSQVRRYIKGIITRNTEHQPKNDVLERAPEWFGKE